MKKQTKSRLSFSRGRLVIALLVSTVFSAQASSMREFLKAGKTAAALIGAGAATGAYGSHKKVAQPESRTAQGSVDAELMKQYHEDNEEMFLTATRAALITGAVSLYARVVATEKDIARIRKNIRNIVDNKPVLPEGTLAKILKHAPHGLSTASIFVAGLSFGLCAYHGYKANQYKEDSSRS